MLHRKPAKPQSAEKVQLRDLLRIVEPAIGLEKQVTVSVQAVSDVDGDDLSALLRTYLKVSEVGGTLILGEVSQCLAEKLQMTRLDRLVEVRVSTPIKPASNAQSASNGGQRSAFRPSPSLFFQRPVID